MKIEEGKYYKDGTGQIIGPMIRNGRPSHPWTGKNGDGVREIFTEAGSYCSDLNICDSNLVSEYIDPITALEEENKRLREALEFYADVSKYPSPKTGGMGDLYFDCGQIARAALSTPQTETT